jgi:hypothetical protein
MDRWKYFHWCVSRGAGGRSKNPHRFRSNSSSTHPRQWTDFCVGFSFRCDATIRRCSRPRYAVFEEHVFCRLRYLPVTIYCNEREKTRRYSRLRGMSKFVMRELRGSSTMGVRRFTLVAMTPDDRFRRYHGARFISIQYGRGGWMEKKFRVSSSRIALSSGCISSVLPTRCPGPSFHPVIPWLISGSRKTCVFTWRGEEKGD